MGNGNENIVHVEAIEGLMCEASAHIELIQPNSPRAQVAKENAQKGLVEYQEGEVHALRILCEGD